MKYIIDIEDKAFTDGNGNKLYKARKFNSLVFDEVGLSKLKPISAEIAGYVTREELRILEEKARQEGWDTGHEEGYRKGRLVSGDRLKKLCKEWTAIGYENGYKEAKQKLNKLADSIADSILEVLENDK